VRKIEATNGGKDLLLPNQVVVLIQFEIDRGIEGVGNKGRMINC